MPPFIDPPQWTDEQLEQDRQTSIARFVDERSTVLGPRYQQTLLKNVAFVRSLFEASDDLRELASGTALAAQPSLIDVARYPCFGNTIYQHWPRFLIEHALDG